MSPSPTLRHRISRCASGVPARTDGVLAITSNVLLAAGGLLIAVTALYLAQYLTDASARSFGLPNFLGGFALLAASVLLSRRTIRRKSLPSAAIRRFRGGGPI